MDRRAEGRRGRTALWIVGFLLAFLLACPGLTAGPLDTWVVRAPGLTANDLDGVAWGGGKFVAVGKAGTILVSSDNGVTWSSSTSGTTVDLWGVAYGGTNFVAVGDSGVILTSSDGKAWTPRTSAMQGSIFGITSGGGKVVGVGVAGYTLVSSDNGITWAAGPSGVPEDLIGVVYGASRFVAVGGYDRILTSPDGATWTLRTSGTTPWLWQVAFGNNIYATVGRGGAILTSPDGAAWTAQVSGTTQDFYGIVYGGSYFVAVGAGGMMFSSPDGITWTGLPGQGYSLLGITYGSSTYLAVGSSGTIVQSGGLTGPPIANAGANTSVQVGATVTLDGSGSYDPQGYLPLAYQWQITGKPSGSEAVLINANQVKATFKPDVAGVYTVSLVVTNSASIASQPAEVTVNAADLPKADAGSSQSVTAGTAVTLDGTKSSDPNGQTLTYSWSLTSVPQGSAAKLASSTTTNPTFMADLAGTYTASLIVTETGGLLLKSPPASVTVTATPIIVPPTPPPPSDPTTPSASSGGGGGGCFIATAVYGSPTAPEVLVLRRFRDTYLLHNCLGRYLVHSYYRISPPAAELAGRYEVLKLLGRAVLSPIVFTLKHPYEAVSFLFALLGLLASRSFRRRPR